MEIQQMSRHIVSKLPSTARVLLRKDSSDVIPRYFSNTLSRRTWVLKPQKLRPFTEPENPIRRVDSHKYWVYDVVDCTHAKVPPPMQVLLMKDLPGLGKAGDIVSVKRNFARIDLVPSGKATYVTPEAIAKFEERKRKEAENPELQSSSPTSLVVRNYLNNMVCNVFMHLHNPWTLEKWHVRAALRQTGVWAPDYAIEMPSEMISGPDRAMHGKCFSIFLTINKKECACVLCRIVLFSREAGEDLPVIEFRGGKLDEPEPLYPGAISSQNVKTVSEATIFKRSKKPFLPLPLFRVAV